MKLYSLLLLAFLSIIFQPRTASQMRYDIFPLSNNLHDSYSIYQLMTSDFVSIFQSDSDSGTVDYIIHDSTQLADTSIRWNVVQRRNLIHETRTDYNDTVYSIIDTSYFPVYESLSGNHELKCSSMIWNFPLNVWPNHYALYSPDSSFYRYAGTSDTLYILSTNPHVTDGWIDSVWFSNKGGMYQRATHSWSDHITVLSYYLNVKQVSTPTGVIQNNLNHFTQFTLLQNFPNPFNPTTTIQYSLSKSATVSLALYDYLGRKVLDIDNGYRLSGEHSVTLHLQTFASGTYFYRLSTNGYSEIRKFILLK